MSIFTKQTTINCRGRLLDLSTPIVMGILNLTPDSFYDGGQHNEIDQALYKAEKMLMEGAAILDLGGMSSRPGAELISSDEEKRRVIPVLEKLAIAFPDAIFSVDTVRAGIAQAALESGAHIINDISAGKFDKELLENVGKYGVPYILMHMQGKPKDMQRKPGYTAVITEIMDFFIEKINTMRIHGIKDIIIDPGFGFGKTVEHNFTILKNLHAFSILNCPVLVGISRKSMICKVLKINPDKALNGTTALHMVALQQGAKILRVHDVQEAKETIQLFQMMARD